MKNPKNQAEKGHTPWPAN